MGMDDSYQNTIWDENMAQIETPLILSPNSHYVHNQNMALYPYNLTAFQGGSSTSNSHHHSTSVTGNSGPDSVDNIFIDTMNENLDETTLFETHSRKLMMFLLNSKNS